MSAVDQAVADCQQRTDTTEDVGDSFSDTRSYPALTFNPTPGNAEAISSLARDFATVATNLGNARDALNEIGQSESVWQGDAADAFRGKVGDLPDYLDKANSSLGDAAKTLDGWADDLTSMQRTAADYEQAAEQAQQRVSEAEANPNLRLAGEQFSNAQALDAAQRELDAASEELDAAQQELSAIRAQAAQLLRQHESLAGQIADALRRAKDEAPEEPGLLSRAFAALGDLIDGAEQLAADIGNWIKAHAKDIAEIGDVLAKIGNVLTMVASVTAWIPGVGEVITAAAIGVNGAALAMHATALLAGDKDVSLSTLVSDGLNMMPLGGAGSALKTSATDAAKLGVKVLKQDGLKALGGVIKEGAGSLGTDAKELITGAPKALEHASDELEAHLSPIEKDVAETYNDSAKSLYNISKAIGVKTVFAQNTVKGMAAITAFAAAKKFGVDKAIDAGAEAVGDAVKHGLSGSAPAPVADSAEWATSKATSITTDSAIDKGFETFADKALEKSITMRHSG